MTSLLNGFEDPCSWGKLPSSLSCRLVPTPYPAARWVSLASPYPLLAPSPAEQGVLLAALTGCHLSSRHFPFVRERGASPSLPPVLILILIRASVSPEPASMLGPPSSRPPLIQCSCIGMCPTGEERQFLQLACVSSHVERRDCSQGWSNSKGQKQIGWNLGHRLQKLFQRAAW